MSLPLLMMVLPGTASFSVALYSLQQVGNATTGAVQFIGEYAALNATITSPTSGKQVSTTDPCQEAVSQVTQALPNYASSKLTYTLTIYYPNSAGTATTSTAYGPTAGNTFSCPAGSALLTANYPVTLTVSYAYSWLPVLNFNLNSPLTSTQTALAE